MKKILFICPFIFFVVPLLLINPYLLITFDGLVLIGVLFIFLFTLPPFGVAEVKQKSNNDQYSAFLIPLMSGIAIITTVIDWAYIKNGETSSWILKSIGIIIMIFGLYIRALAIKILGKQFTSTVQIVQQHTLIIKGPYKLIRHPSYFGALLVIVGIPLFLGSWLGIIISFISMLIAYYYRIKVEEKTLLDYFGNDYYQYRKKTKKLFPYIW